MVQLGVAAAMWSDLARRAPAEVRGPKWRWAALIAVGLGEQRGGIQPDPGRVQIGGGPNYAGPIVYSAWE